MNRSSSTSEVGDYLAILRARKWTVILVTLLTTGSALAFSLTQQKVYTATARVLVQSPTASSIQPFVPTVNIQTESEVVSSEPVAKIALDNLEISSSLEQLLGGLSVDTIVETEVLVISYTSADPELARKAANAFASGYLEQRRVAALEGLLSEERAVQGRLEAASEEFESLAGDIEEAREAGDISLATTLETQRNTLVARLGVLQQRLDDLQANRAARTSVGQVIEEAETPSSPSSPKHVVNVALGFFLGFPLAVGLALARERSDDRFRGRQDVETIIGAPVLGVVPTFPKGVERLITQDDPQSVAAEAYRTLRTNLQFIVGQRDIKTILVTSPSPREGKTVTTANLAVMLADAGNRVIVVSGDLRRPTLEGCFGIDTQGPGLSTWLADKKSGLLEGLRDPGIPDVRLLASGPIPPNPAELLTSDRLYELLEILEENADYVLIDSAPVLPVADAGIIASKVRATLLVIDFSSTTRTSALGAKQEIERVGGTVRGLILNSFDVGTSHYYGAHKYTSDTRSGTKRSEGNGGSGPRHEKARRA
jgi:capsular exopolysaccharide synthesis family protein